MSSVPVSLYEGQPINYNSHQSCVKWDVVNNILLKVKCDTKQPIVCYKKRADVTLPAAAPTPGVETVTALTPPGEFKKIWLY